jgi:hypothetical protein
MTLMRYLVLQDTYIETENLKTFLKTFQSFKIPWVQVSE